MFHVIIPARYASTRLPGKPLQDILGKPMIRHVWEQACRSAAESVTIATDDQRIVDACRSFGADVVMTRPDHPSGTDRLQEVVTQLRLDDDRKSTRLNSSHVKISYAGFCLKKKTTATPR